METQQGVRGKEDIGSIPVRLIEHGDRLPEMITRLSL